MPRGLKAGGWSFPVAWRDEIRSLETEAQLLTQLTVEVRNRAIDEGMEAGDAEFGVLCADHHPGYSQPIGGGIAYSALAPVLIRWATIPSTFFANRLSWSMTFASWTSRCRESAASSWQNN